MHALDHRSKIRSKIRCLTDSVGHAVKENPLIIISREADIVASLNTNDRQELKVGYSIKAVYFLTLPMMMAFPIWVFMHLFRT